MRSFAEFVVIRRSQDGRGEKPKGATDAQYEDYLEWCQIFGNLMSVPSSWGRTLRGGQNRKGKEKKNNNE